MNAEMMIFFVALVIIVVFVWIIKLILFDKGKAGESRVRNMFESRLPRGEYEIIKHVTLRAGNGTTQIDHIILSVFGIFVVETKNKNGWIFGGENQRYWTQVIFKYKNQFQNPLHQNYKHTQVLQKLLGIGREKIFSLVVFVGESKFKTAMPENVTYCREAISYIRSKRTAVMSPEQVLQAKEAILTSMLERSSKTDREHARHVREIIATKRKNNKPSGCFMLFLILIVVLVLIVWLRVICS